jgi:hypothetical protein
VRVCRGCERRYEPDEKELWACPNCNRHRGCSRFHKRGARRCRRHGANAVSGPEHPQFRHGRYSKDLPTRLAQDYYDSLRDPDLLNLSEEVALTNARIAEQLRRVDSGETGEHWKRLRRTVREIRRAIRAKDTDQYNYLVGVMLRNVEEGAADWLRWEDITRLQHHKKNLAETERKINLDKEQMIEKDRVTLLIGAFAQIATRYVKDPDDRRAIGAEIRGLLGQPDRPALRGGG